MVSYDGCSWQENNKMAAAKMKVHSFFIDYIFSGGSKCAIGLYG
jgi:hypothetical protein